MEEGNDVEEAADYKALFQGKVIRAFLHAKWDHVRCEVCGGQNLELGRTEERPAVAFGLLDADGNKTNSYWPVVPVICTDCGNAKILFLPIIEDWVASEEGKKAIAEADEEEPA